MKHMFFSVLISVYYKENPEFFKQSLDSVFTQTLTPDEVVLVEDGDLTNELYAVINSYCAKYSELKIVKLEKNSGLGVALNEGLKYCSYDLVARMDTDDISCKDRFEKQIKYFNENPNLALLSGYIEEFDSSPSNVVSVRKVPCEYSKIKTYLKKRNAFNHTAVMFRKSAVMESGGYQHVPYLEDHDLWIRMIQKGYLAANLPDILVKVRVGADMIGRRHGFEYAKYELSFLKRQLKTHFISKIEFVILVILRIPVRLLPKFLLSYIYKVLRGIKRK